MAGLLGGLLVGLTGMGGGALMTPMLVLIFNVDPLAAVSSDVMASLVMKPIGGSVHMKHGSVHGGIVKWLSLGSVPSAFIGVLALRSLEDLTARLEQLLGVALLVAATAMTVRILLQSHRNQAVRDIHQVPVRVLPTVAVGIVGGLIVGLTSVGSGSVMIVLLLGLYPRLKASALVGTDLVQAVPLVASAALGHLLFGDVQFGVTGSLLIGCVPGVYAGARLSSKAPDQAIRPLLVAVLIASAIKLLDGPTGLAVAAAVALASVTVLVSRSAQRRDAAAPAVTEAVPGPGDDLPSVGWSPSDL